MLFNSWQYAVFFPLVFGLYWGLPYRFRLPVLLVASYWFYMSWNVKYVVLILFTTAISYAAALLIERYPSCRTRELIITATIFACLGVLFVFKYFNFFAGAVSEFLSLFAIHLHPMTLQLLLPVGISFYTFQTLGYVIDVYRGDVKAERNFWVYATFISFFPQLVAGPIERTNNLLPQIKAVHEFRYEQAAYGIKLMTWGFFKKLCVADVLAVYVDKVFADVYSYKGFALVLAVFFFTVQIYCDFSGYSDIARGCSKMLGIELMENFKSPYFSASVKEFWSRWHISLSTWFRDYVYIPLGGNRCGKLRHNVNLMVTFLVSGLWHGADWTFVVWGAVHGLAQVAENALGVRREVHGVMRWLRVAGTFAFVMLAWVFFRAGSLNDAVYVAGNLFTGLSDVKAYFIYYGYKCFEIPNMDKLSMLVNVIILALWDWYSLKLDLLARVTMKKSPVLRYACYFGLLTILLLTEATAPVSFVYFQF
ncbi:MAG: MBOAT family protein [Synergistaceae bacterium]|nr:MBOAT family protein [Synergistaceae bacterium]